MTSYCVFSWTDKGKMLFCCQFTRYSSANLFSLHALVYKLFDWLNNSIKSEEKDLKFITGKAGLNKSFCDCTIAERFLLPVAVPDRWQEGYPAFMNPFMGFGKTLPYYPMKYLLSCLIGQFEVEILFWRINYQNC